MNLFVLSYYILIVVLFVMAGVFLVLPLPKTKSVENYSLSLKLLSVSYGILGIYCIFKWMYPIDIVGLPFLFSATLQAHLLGMTYINMVNSSVITKKYVVKKLVLPIVLAVLTLLSIAIGGYHHIGDYKQFLESLFSSPKCDVYLRILWFVYYVVLCLSYIYSFFKQEKLTREQLEDYSSDAHSSDLKFINFSFYLVILIILDTFCITLGHNRDLCTIFNFIILFLYICVGLFYVKSLKFYLILQEEEWQEQKECSVVEAKYENWVRWRQIIIDRDLYLRPGVTIVQIAQELNTNRSSLSAAINQQEGKNFSAFIKSLRIGKAKEIMRSNPKMSLADVSVQVGYTDPGNFSRQFKDETGLSPLVWRQGDNNKN